MRAKGLRHKSSYQVSIRAPAWAINQKSKRPLCTWFLSAPRVGAIQSGRGAVFYSFSFYPRPRVGDALADVFDGFHHMFLSAPPRGRYIQRAKPIARQRVSIRAPAWGAMTLLIPVTTTDGVSIRAPAWGAMTKTNPKLAYALVSIRAPAWGRPP